MADFTASAAVSGDALNWQTLLTSVNSLPVKYTSSAGDAGTINTASTSLVDTTDSVTITAVSDELIFLVCEVDFSANTTGAGAGFQIQRGGAAKGKETRLVQWAGTSTNGNVTKATLFAIESGLSGSTTWDLYWKNVFTAGTVYSAFRQWSVFQFKIRS